MLCATIEFELNSFDYIKLTLWFAHKTKTNYVREWKIEICRPLKNTKTTLKLMFLCTSDRFELYIEWKRWDLNGEVVWLNKCFVVSMQTLNFIFESILKFSNTQLQISLIQISPGSHPQQPTPLDFLRDSIIKLKHLSYKRRGKNCGISLFFLALISPFSHKIISVYWRLREILINSQTKGINP